MKETPLWYSLLRGLAILLFRVLFFIKIQGKKNIPPRGGMILASNHLSYLDPIVLGLVVPRRMNFIAKEELFENFLFRWLITQLGALPVRRERMDRMTYQKILDLLKKEEIIAFFPEGTRSADGRIGELHQGTTRIALKTNVPLIPIIIQGTDKVLPREKKIIRLARIKVRVGKPLISEISPQRPVTKRDIEEFHMRLEERMKMLTDKGLS